MKINVLTVDKQIIPLHVDHNDLVGNVKAKLDIEKEELLYNGKELKNSDKLSEIGVQDGDSIVVVSETTTVSSSSTPELGFNTNGSAKKLAAFLHEIRNNSYLVAQLVQSDPEFAQAIAEDDHHRLQALLRQRHQQREQSRQRDGEHGFTNFKNAPINGEGEVCLTFLAEKEMSHLLNEDKYLGNHEVNEEVKIQSNDGATHSEENNHDQALNSSDKESSTASIQKVGLGDLNDFVHFSSHEHHNDSQGIEARKSELLDPSLSPSMSSPLSPNPQSTTKGHGLKKWRRIRREFTKDPSSNLDSTKVLKRGSSNISDVKKPNHSPMSSTNAFVKSPGPADLFSDAAPSSSYSIAIGTTFRAGADDSDDRNSKSSTAASAPKHSHHQREKNKVKNVSGKHLNHISGQRFQLAKGHAQADASKKPRGESIDNLDKENSLSSMESDSRSYNSVFPRGSSSVNSDQAQSRRSANYDEEYDQQASEVQSSRPPQAGYSKNCDISPECSAGFSYGASTGKSKDHQVSKDCEPLINSILLLQSAQEALEREVQMFKEIGKGVSSFCDDLSNTNGLSAYSVFVGTETLLDRSHVPEAAFNHVQSLERQLDETQVKLKEKDLKVLELEKIIINMNMKCSQEMEAELEAVFKLKVEAEVQCVVMAGFSKDLGVLVEDQIKVLRDQYLEQSQKLIADAENKGSILQGQGNLDNLKNDTTDYDEIQKMQSRMSKYSSYLIIQLVLLVLVVGLFLFRVLPKSATVVPT